MDRINRNANISAIEDFLYTELMSVSDNVKIGFFPEVLKEGDDDALAMIDLANDIDLKATPIKVNAYIWLCAKNISGTKNSYALKQMEEALDDVVSAFQDEENIYMLSKVKANTSPIDGTDFYSNVYTVQITVL